MLVTDVDDLAKQNKKNGTNIPCCHQHYSGYSDVNDLDSDS